MTIRLQKSAPAPRYPRRRWRDLVREMAADQIDRAVFAVTAVLVGFGYSLLLPFAFTQRIAFGNLSYLDARYLAFAVAFGLGLASLITLQVHAVRRLASTSTGDRPAVRTGPLGALAAVVSVLPSLLCCSPILPTLIGLLGLSATTRLTTTVQLQHFFATKENLVLVGALVLLLASSAWSMRKLTREACITDNCHPTSAANPSVGITPGKPRPGDEQP